MNQFHHSKIGPYPTTVLHGTNFPDNLERSITHKKVKNKQNPTLPFTNVEEK